MTLENQPTPSMQTSVQLARHLGVFDATMIGIGAMIGAGIFVLTGIAIGQAGPAALLAFALNGVVTLFTALSYAELSSAIPEAGGAYSFVKKVMPNPVAFASGWMLWFAYIVACALYARGFSSYFLEFFHQQLPTWTEAAVHALGANLIIALLTLGIGLLFILINIIGTHASGKAENIITLTKLAILGVFIFFGYRKVAAAPDVALQNLRPFFPTGFAGVFSAMGLTFIAFEGYDLIATVSEEVRDPRRTIPRAILYSLAVTMFVYLSVVFVSLAATPPAQGLPVWQLLGKYGETGIIEAARGFMPAFGVFLILFGGLFATLSALNATILASSRVAFSMGRDWMLPHRLSRIHPIRRTPVVAISVSGLIFLAIATLLPIETLGNASSLLFLLTFSLVNLSLIYYRRRSTAPPPYQTPFFPLIPVLGMATSLGLGLFQLRSQPMAWVLAVGWILVGIVIYQLTFARKATVAEVSRVMEEPDLLRLKSAKRYKILLPVANPSRVQPLVTLAAKLARGTQGEVLAMTVVTLPNITAYSKADALLAQPQQLLNTVQALALQEAIPLTSLLKIGRSAADEIVQTARETRCDLILMGYKREQDPLENSVIYHIVTHQPCDVAILKSDHAIDEELQRILVPIGGKVINDALKVRLIYSLYKDTGCRVTLMTVVPPHAGRLQRKRAQEALRTAAALYQIPDVELVLDEHEDVAEAIIARAGEHDLLVLGMREEPWLQSFFFGTVTQRVASQVQCPTLLVKAYLPEKTRLKRLIRR